MQRQCAEYAKLGLMGVTVLYASGDAGVAGSDGECLDRNGNPSSSRNTKRFVPSFPPSCPYVTAVGATQMVSGASVNDAEVACQDSIISGGGFSNIFAMPSWQQSTVEHYLQTYPPSVTSANYNTSGSRAYPDIALNGAKYLTAVLGDWYPIYGTSASTPASAAILSAINDARLAAGKGPIGFINPIIYSSGFQGAFNDITKGANPGCGTDGFSAHPGWDPVTGMGTVNFSKLLAKWLALP
ncbi:Aorsin [Grifola frondosa]|uniref:Aorsin n=1 Tax=Grifola frondosa TaxID=5627 RepID=A0A1C7M7F9_GRIFR|nr:Aorsin [Grifola frondosa]